MIHDSTILVCSRESYAIYKISDTSIKTRFVRLLRVGAYTLSIERTVFRFSRKRNVEITLTCNIIRTLVTAKRTRNFTTTNRYMWLFSHMEIFHPQHVRSNQYLYTHDYVTSFCVIRDIHSFFTRYCGK